MLARWPHYPFPHPLFLVLAFLALLSPLALVPAFKGRWRVIKKPSHVIPAAGAALTLAYLVYTFWYVSIEAFTDHIEPMVSSVSWLWVSGKASLYHPLEAAERTSFIYGPMLYIMNGLVMKVLGPSAASAKLAGVLAASGSLACIFLIAKKRATAAVAFVYLGFSTLILLFFQEMSFWARTDPLILLSVSLGLLTVLGKRRGLGIMAAALTLGLAVNLKAHALLYFLPILTLVKTRWGWKALVLAAAAAGFIALLPFALPGVSLPNYLAWLGIAKAHGLKPDILLNTAEFAGFILLPLTALFFQNQEAGPGGDGRRPSYLVSLLVSTALVTLLAAKPGSGPHHLIPFIPLVAYPAAPAIARFKWDALPQKLAGLVLAALFLSACAIAIPHQSIRVPRLLRMSQVPVHDDLKNIMEKLLDLKIAMGYGTNQDYFLTFFRAALVHRGHPYLVDGAALMDMQLGGLAVPEATHEAIRNCEIDVWLIPRGAAPFSMASSYEPYPPLFEESFRRAFLEHYEIKGQSTFFDLWGCRGR
ncbi:MAG: hypothetical protein HYY14_03355 [Candidatus Omnitrophica bacterium]|nr:hypothetical protein [Candidatus Omnitrophota bacterium]